jgi:hypothetical protein
VQALRLQHGLLGRILMNQLAGCCGPALAKRRVIAIIDPGRCGMRKVIVWNLVSLDGYYEGPGRDVMVLPLDGSFDAYSAERLRAADILLLR